MKIALQHFWVRGVKITPFTQHCQKSIYDSLVTKLKNSGLSITKEVQEIVKISIPSDVTRTSTKFYYQEFLPKGHLPDDLEELETLHRKIREDLENKGYVGCILKLSRRNQYISIQWEARYPPTDHFVKMHSKELRRLTNAIKLLCKKYYSVY